LVLSLTPKLIPKKYLQRLSKYSHQEIEDFEGKDLELPQNELKKALNPLADYLLAVTLFFLLPNKSCLETNRIWYQARTTSEGKKRATTRSFIGL
jgi:hypothetical protein